MKFSIEERELTKVKTALLVVNMHDGKVGNSGFAHEIDKKLNGELAKLLKREKFEGKIGQSKLLSTHGKISAENVLVVGLGDKKDFNGEAIRKASARAMRVAKQIHAAHVTTAAHGGHLGVIPKGECAQIVVESMILADYDFYRYKKKPETQGEVDEITILCPTASKVAEVKSGIAKGQAIGEAVSRARDLVNTPAEDMTPLILAKHARNLPGVQTRIFNVDQIRKMKMGAYLGVSQGGIHPPAFIEMHYKPAGKPKKRVVLVGKAVTFDSGGYSIKPAKFMETMKEDMAGAAAVISLMSIISQLKPKVEVWGLAAATENMIGSKAQRPGDIVTAMNGKTIEVVNTDAEGRLTLADAVYYGTKKKPDYIVDIATLTGACVVALGNRIAGVMGTDKKLIEHLIKAGEKSGEKIWELPLEEDYMDEVKGSISDLKNSGSSGYAGTIHGGLFIKQFIEKTKWAHIDIAGPSWTDRPLEYEVRGGTGCMVRMLANFLDSL